MLVSGGHDEKDFYGLVTNKYNALAKADLLEQSWLLVALDCSHVAIINPHIQPRGIFVICRTIMLKIILHEPTKE